MTTAKSAIGDLLPKQYSQLQLRKTTSFTWWSIAYTTLVAAVLYVVLILQFAQTITPGNLLHAIGLIIGMTSIFVLTGFAHAMTGTPKHILELQQKANIYEAMLKAQSDLDEGFIIIDDQRIVYANDACERMTGYTRQELLDFPSFLLLIAPSQREVMVKRLQKRMKGEPVAGHYETAITNKNGKKVDILVATKEFSIEGYTQLAVLAQDITKRKNIERAQSEFVSWVSHQLKTPLAAQKWQLEMLLEGDEGEIQPEQKESLLSVMRANHRMFALISSLLNLAKMQLGTLVIESEPTNLIELSDSVLRELAPLIEPKNLQIEKDYNRSMPIVSVDPEIARIVFQNLLSNAAKYTPKGGKISVRVTREGTNAVIVVSDTGIGISESDQKQLFSKFFRGSNAKETDGSGLGLHMTQKIIQLCGGTLECESKVGEGTTFTVRLPV